MIRVSMFIDAPREYLRTHELCRAMVLLLLLASSVCTLSAFAQNSTSLGDTQLDALKALAEKGNAEAQLKLADMYRAGKDAALNVGEAAKWYRKAAEQGSAEAQFKLGELLLEGKGIAQNIQEALIWLEKSAAQGFKAAKDKLAEVKSKAQDSVKDLNKALDLIR